MPEATPDPLRERLRQATGDTLKENERVDHPQQTGAPDSSLVGKKILGQAPEAERIAQKQQGHKPRLIPREAQGKHEWLSQNRIDKIVAGMRKNVFPIWIKKEISK